MDANFPRSAKRLKKFALILLGFAAIVCLILPAKAQEVCVSPERIQALKSDFESQKSVAENATLKSEILQMKTDLATLSTQENKDKAATPSQEQAQKAAER